MVDASAKPGRRFLRFSLRTFLAIAVLIGAALGLAMHKVREQGRAVAALERLGCTIRHANYNASPTVMERLRRLLTKDDPMNVTGVSAYMLQTLPDDGLSYIRGLPELTHLDLRLTPVTDAGLARARIDKARIAVSQRYEGDRRWNAASTRSEATEIPRPQWNAGQRCRIGATARTVETQILASRRNANHGRGAGESPRGPVSFEN